MDNHIGLFVDNDQIRVLIDYVQWNVFRRNFFAWRFRKSQIDFVARAELEARFDTVTVNFDTAVFYCILDESPAEIPEPRVQVFIDPALLDSDSHVKSQGPFFGIWKLLAHFAPQIIYSAQ